MTYGKVIAKVVKYAFSVFMGYEIHDQIVGPKTQLVPFVEKQVFEKKMEHDEPSETQILLYAILGALLIVVLVAVAIGGAVYTKCNKAAKNIRKSLDA